MKARNAKERAVEAATERYIRPNGSEEECAIKNAARPHNFIRTPLNSKQRGVWCTSCGETIDYNPDLLVNMIEGKDQSVTCPHCGAKLTRGRFQEENVGHKYYRDYSIVMKAETYGPWQVLRYYYVYFQAERGKEPVMGNSIEVVRRWYNIEKGGRPVVWSRGNVMGSWRGCGFNLNAALTLKREDQPRPNYYGTANYRVREDAVVPGSRWHRLMRRDGFKGESTMRLLDLDSSDIPVIFSTPQLVTLYKSRQYSLLRYYGGGASRNLISLKEDWPSIKVALRHGYRIKDIGMWHDYIKQLRELGEDTRSPRWICPDNLTQAHRRTDVRINRLRKLKDIEKAKQRAAEAEKKYAMHIAAFRDLLLKESGVVIAVIPTVEDVRQEGEHMHHCVFNMRYYEKDDSLLLSARSSTGQRLETIEFDLKTGAVLQSRAFGNQNSPKHGQILKMMENASGQIVETWRRAKFEKNKIKNKPVAGLARAIA